MLLKSRYIVIALAFIGVLAFVRFKVAASGTVYYVSPTGSDSYDGTEQTHTTGSTGPWQTIAKVYGSSFNPGDSVLFQAGGTWREQLTVPSSGSAGSPITFGAYGSGAKPVISGADLLTSWTSAAVTPAFVAPVVVCQPAITTSVSTLNCTGSIGTAGSTLIITGYINDTYASMTVSDTKGNSWVTNSTTPLLNTALYTNVNNNNQTWYVPANNGAGSDTFTITLPGGGSHTLELVVTEWAGNLAAAYDGSNSATNQSSGGNTTDSLTSGASSGSSGNTNDLVYGQCTGGAAITVGTGFSSLAAYNYGQNNTLEYKSGAGNSAGTCTQASSTVWAAQVITFKASVAPFTAYHATVGGQPNQVIWDGARINSVATQGALVSGTWWWDAGNSYVWVRDNPAGHTVTASQRQYAIYATGESYITINGIEAREAQNSGVVFYDTSNYPVVSNVLADWNFNDGLLYAHTVSQTSMGGTVSGGTYSYNGASGIDLGTGASGWMIENNITHHNSALGGSAGVASLQHFSAGIHLFGATNTTVEYNVTHDNGVTLTLAQANDRGNGIHFDTVVSPCIMEYNLIYNNVQMGAYLENDNGCVVIGNIVYGQTFANQAAGVAVTYSNTNISQNNLVYNNTSYGNKNGIFNMGLYGGGAGTSLNNTFKNNISVASTQVNLLAIYGGENDGTNGSGNVYLYNDFGTVASSFLEWGASVYFSTYALWEAATGNCGTTGCSHSTQTNPTFASTNGQFWQTAGSPGIAAGTPLGSPYNLGIMPGSSWPNNVFLIPNTNSDLGAYPFGQGVIDSVLSSGTVASGTVK